jgi:hypothetical protein
MWNVLKRKSQICDQLRDSLEERSDLAALSRELQLHLQACGACQTTVSQFEMSRGVLRNLSSRTAEPGAWFVSRVMAAISAREAELRRSLDTWSVLPRLAARLSWVSALALLLACTWLYEKPRSAPNGSNDGTTESLLDPSSVSAAPDDVLVSHLETPQ